jgi:hypothetical protein
MKRKTVYFYFFSFAATTDQGGSFGNMEIRVDHRITGGREINEIGEQIRSLQNLNALCVLNWQFLREEKL